MPQLNGWATVAPRLICRTHYGLTKCSRLPFNLFQPESINLSPGFFAVRIVLVNHVYTQHSTLDLEKEFSDGSQFLTMVLLKLENKEKLLLFIIKVWCEPGAINNLAGQFPGQKKEGKEERGERERTSLWKRFVEEPQLVENSTWGAASGQLEKGS